MIKFKKKYLFGIILGLILIVLDTIYFLRSRWFFTFLIIALNIGWSQFWIDFFRENKRQKEIESRFLQFVRSLVSTVKSGVSIPNSIIQIADEEYGELTPYAKKLKNDINNAIRYLVNERRLTYIDIISNLLGISLNEKYYGYVILPSFDANGKLNYFLGRTFIGNYYRYKKCDAKSKEIIYNEINIDWQKPLLIVEGPFDVIRSHVNATCLLGSTMSRDSLLFQKIIENNVKILLSLDPDETGKKKSIGIASLLTEYGIDVTMVDIDSKYEDIADMPQNEWKQVYKSSVADNKIINKTELLKRKLKEIM